MRKLFKTLQDTTALLLFDIYRSVTNLESCYDLTFFNGITFLFLMHIDQI